MECGKVLCAMQQASQWRDDAKEIIKATASKKTMVDILHHPQHIDPVH